jgi:hypothetical protein
MSQSLSGASKGFGGGKSLTATGAAAKMHGPGAKMAGALGTAQKVVSTTQKIVQAGSEIAQLSTQIAEGRADLGVMLKGGMSVLGGVMPQLTQRISLLRNLPAAVDLVQTVDAAASGDAGAGAILLGRMARAFGAKVPQQALNAAATAVTAVQSVAQGNSLPSPADVAAQLLRLQQQLKSGKIDKKTFDLLRSQLPNGGVPAAGGTP